MVESFPLNDVEDYKCTIFGHTCPVFIVAEPLTETKKQKNISRNIPQKVKFEVIRRDGYVCQKCHTNIPYENINFDHIIPWSKGGSSESSNIRVLCEKCNKARGNSYEDEYLKIGALECYHDALELDTEQVRDLLGLHLLWILMEKHEIETTEKIFCDVISNGNIDDIETDKFMYMLVAQINELLTSSTSFINVRIKMHMLRYRWGLADGKIHNIAETCNKFKKEYNYYIELETRLLRQIGFILREYSSYNEQYIYLKEDIPQQFTIIVEEKHFQITL